MESDTTEATEHTCIHMFTYLFILHMCKCAFRIPLKNYWKQYMQTVYG